MVRTLTLAILLFLFSLLPLKAAAENLCIKDICLQVELVDSPEKRTQGLMFRENLPDNQGMLFVFEEEARHSFWMKNMKFSLDIIWIDNNKRIVEIKENVPPCQGPCDILTPPGKAKYVLEVNSGFADKHQIKLGDEVNF